MRKVKVFIVFALIALALLFTACNASISESDYTSLSDIDLGGMDDFYNVYLGIIIKSLTDIIGQDPTTLEYGTEDYYYDEEHECSVDVKSDYWEVNFNNHECEYVTDDGDAYYATDINGDFYVYFGNDYTECHIFTGDSGVSMTYNNIEIIATLDFTYYTSAGVICDYNGSGAFSFGGISYELTTEVVYYFVATILASMGLISS